MNLRKPGPPLVAAVVLSLAGLSGVLVPSPAPAQTPPTAQEWIERLKLAPARDPMMRGWLHKVDRDLRARWQTP